VFNRSKRRSFEFFKIAVFGGIELKIVVSTI